MAPDARLGTARRHDQQPRRRADRTEHLVERGIERLTRHLVKRERVGRRELDLAAALAARFQRDHHEHLRENRADAMLVHRVRLRPLEVGINRRPILHFTLCGKPAEIDPAVAQIVARHVLADCVGQNRLHRDAGGIARGKVRIRNQFTVGNRLVFRLPPLPAALLRRWQRREEIAL
ncbi:hypothetical protein SDC9_120358 [bioreactor metagenome]|uniref:Uncharacterized protein n=1 Tax=bioreactor metagenome TaxID=1076179 RepID=A0A645C7L7_9ZZZZ